MWTLAARSTWPNCPHQDQGRPHSGDIVQSLFLSFAPRADIEVGLLLADFHAGQHQRASAGAGAFVRACWRAWRPNRREMESTALQAMKGALATGLINLRLKLAD
jgi:hypothetical protein